MTTASLDNPVLNSPYEPPASHFAVDDYGRPTGEVRPGRRQSTSSVPIPVTKKGGKGRGTGGEQQGFDFDIEGERYEANTLINDIRPRVERWRANGYQRVTPVSRKLLQHWADPGREDRVLFCQREAAETAIYLAEVAGRHGEPDFRTRLAAQNALHNDDLPRIGLKMATGTGKTIVMAMLIAWQTANKVYSPRDARFTNRFLVVAPGITIRDRLRVLLPADDENYYDLRSLVPQDLRSTLDSATVVITNYHSFLPKTAKEAQGISTVTRKVLRAGKPGPDPFEETDKQVVDRVLRDLRTRGKGEVLVLNDEAHHCYQDKLIDSDDAKEEERARVWFRGIQAIARRAGVKGIYDLSATPYYLGGSGYYQGYIFPWVVSDFGLMDAIESGIVKVPRIPVDDDLPVEKQPVYLYLWDHVGDNLPKRVNRKAESDQEWVPPAELQGALESLYRSYKKRFEEWRDELAPLGEPPPVMIVVCPNTLVSRLVYDWIAGQEVEQGDGSVTLRPGNLELLSNVDDKGQWRRRDPTILVDSQQLESGEALKPDFKKAAAHEIEVFQHEYRQRNPGADVTKLTDEDLLREVMNTVGKKGRLGEQVRCVVSVSMLSEGWDANTVTHVLGIRRFGSQLLCEQVVGRGLRRRSYEPNADGLFEPEYAEVYGVPFSFIPSDRRPAPAPPTRPAVEVRAIDNRWPLRIEFPKLDGYRTELPDKRLVINHECLKPVEVDQHDVAFWTETEGILGETEEQALDDLRDARLQEVAYGVAAETLRRYFTVHDGVSRPWLFPELVDVSRRWLEEKVTFVGDTPPGILLLAQPRSGAAAKINDAVIRMDENLREPLLLPLVRQFDGTGSTDGVSFFTRQHTQEARKSHVNLVVLDGPKGNSWEATTANLLEDHPKVAAYVKNNGLGFEIPYVYEGRRHMYVPDFLARLEVEPGDVMRTLIIEVSGGLKSHASPGPTAVKATTARDQWCHAVNNDQRWGLWGYVELTSMLDASEVLDRAVDRLLSQRPTTELAAIPQL